MRTAPRAHAPTLVAVALCAAACNRPQNRPATGGAPLPAAERAQAARASERGPNAASAPNAVDAGGGGAALPFPGVGLGAVVARALPPPFHTDSASNPPRVVARPEGAALQAPPGFRVNEFATGFSEARWLALAPNGDVFVTEHEANRVIALRDADGDGRAELRRVFAERLNQPFGLAFHPSGWLYVANTDGVVRFRYAPGQLEAAGAPARVCDLPGRGYNQHWTRNVVFSPDGQRMFVTVGSETNVSVESDPRRAAVSVYAPDGSGHRVFASGLRNPIGLAFHPATRALYAVVNERDGLGDDLVPDYLTEVRDGAFYGWPYSYFGQIEDPRRRGERPDLVARAVVPDVALGAHTAALGLAFVTSDRAPPEYRGDAIVSLHGSWNRARRSGYRVVRVRFANGRPTGEVTDFLSGFLLPDGRVWGRPVGVLETPRDGAILVVDDASGTIFRVVPDSTRDG